MSRPRPFPLLAIVGSLLACQPVDRPSEGKTRAPAAAVEPAAEPAANPEPTPPATDATRAPGFEGKVPRLVAGEGLGPFAIGMTRPEFEAAAKAAGLEPRPGFTEANAYAGPYFVAFTDPGARMSTVMAPFKDIGGVVFEGTTLPPTLPDAKAVAGALRGCGTSEIVTGGNVIRCAGRISVETHAPNGVVQIRVESEQAAQLIDE